jgi:F0F1-type ATP synthase assembly protein I
MAADPPPAGPRIATGLMVMGSEMAGFTMLGVVVDFAVGTMPWFTVGLTLLGFVTVFLHLMRFAKSMSRSKGNSP